MISRTLLGAYQGPILAYVLTVVVITIMRGFLPSEYVFPLAAVLMFGMPFLMKSDVVGLRWNLRGVLIGVTVSIVILSLYVLIIGKPIQPSRVSFSLIVPHLVLVAIPEEVFFRGYLQERIGNNLRGVLFVSLLFSVAHLVTRCLGGGCSGMGYLLALLTFFPSIVMGYMYVISGTLWANITFHFLANVVYVSTGGL